jgi:hypothetical protein
MSTIQIIDTDRYSGITTVASSQTISWADDNFVDHLPQSCIQLVISALCPEECACGALPLSAEWRMFYEKRDEKDYCLPDLVQLFPFDGVILVLEQGPKWANDVTYFFMPSNSENASWLLV